MKAVVDTNQATMLLGQLRDEQRGILEIKAREKDAFDRMRDIAKNLRELGVNIQIGAKRASGAARARNVGPQIISWFTENPGRHTAMAVTNGTGLRNGTVYSMLRRLVREERMKAQGGEYFLSDKHRKKNPADEATK